MSVKARPAYDRIMEKCIRNNETGCLEFFGCHNKGYGKIKIGGKYGKHKYVHRVIWEHKNGKIPEGLQICHHCDNPRCCEPNHLFLGTHADNMKDMANKDRAHRTIGELSGNCKLTSAQIESIRKDTRMQTVIAKEYSVAKSTICQIKNGTQRVYD